MAKKKVESTNWDAELERFAEDAAKKKASLPPAKMVCLTNNKVAILLNLNVELVEIIDREVALRCLRPLKTNGDKRWAGNRVPSRTSLVRELLEIATAKLAESHEATR